MEDFEDFGVQHVRTCIDYAGGRNSMTADQIMGLSPAVKAAARQANLDAGLTFEVAKAPSRHGVKSPGDQDLAFMIRAIYQSHRFFSEVKTYLNTANSQGLDRVGRATNCSFKRFQFIPLGVSQFEKLVELYGNYAENAMKLTPGHVLYGQPHHLAPLYGFTVNFIDIPGWQRGLNALSERLAAKNLPPVPGLQDAMRTFLQFSTDYLLSNGTMRGVLGRMERCLTTWELTHWKKSGGVTDRTWTLEQTQSALKACFPNGGPLLPQARQLMRAIVGLLNDGGEEEITIAVKEGYLSINPHADPGYPWEQTQTKSETAPADIISALDLWRYLRARAKGGAGLHELIDELIPVSVTRNKPKLEVISRAKWTTKIRQINVAPAVLNIHLGLICTVVKRELKTPFEDQAPDTILSLGGFTPFHGGLGRLMTRMFQQEYSIAFYADNIFLTVGGWDPVLYSLDAKTFESSASVFDGMALMDAYCGVLKVDAASTLVFKALGAISCCSMTVIQDVIFPVPGMATGVSPTFDINHFRMARYVNEIQFDEEVLAKLKEGDEYPLPDGSHLVLEFQAASRKEGRYETFKEAQRLGEGVNLLEEFGPLVRCDVLGFDCTLGMVRGELHLACCLNYERLWRAIVFRKKSKEALKELAEAVDLMTVVTLYIVGGFAYQDASIALQEIASSIAIHIRDKLGGSLLTLEENKTIFLEYISSDLADRGINLDTTMLKPMVELLFDVARTGEVTLNKEAALNLCASPFRIKKRR